MYFHRGLHIRPQMENFRLGVHKAQQAILNTIGQYNYTSFISSFFTGYLKKNLFFTGKSVPSFEKFLSQRSQIASQDLKSSQCIPGCKITSTIKNPKIDKSHDKKLLKELHADKMYFEKLMRNPGTNHFKKSPFKYRMSPFNFLSDINYVSGNPKLDNRILNEAKQGMEFLESRQYFWKQQQALVSVKAAGSAKSSKSRLNKASKSAKHRSRD